MASRCRITNAAALAVLVMGGDVGAASVACSGSAAKRGSSPQLLCKTQWTRSVAPS